MGRHRPGTLAGGWRGKPGSLAALAKHRHRSQTPEYQAQCRAFNRELVRQARERHGCVQVYLYPAVVAREDATRFYGTCHLRGERWKLTLPEPVDLWELLADLGRFFAAWRPSRLRTEGGQLAAKDVLAQWERLAGEVRRD